MQLKKLTTFSLLILVLIIFSLSTISAADQTISDTSTGGILQCITNTGNGDTLYLNPGIYNKTNQDNNITISKNITIQGNESTDKIIIDARGLSNIFTIGNRTNIIFLNITFINANTSSAGEAITNWNASILTFTNCSFIGNNANSGSGVFNSGGNLTINGCNLTNNYGIATGGGISHMYGNLTLSDSIFINTAANTNGGAIRVASYSFTVINSTFINNTSYNSSSAIHSLNTVGNILSSNFINNTAGGHEGAINNNVSTILSDNVMNGNIVNNLEQMIYNNETMGILNLTYLNNSTVVASNRSTVTIYATLTDDMGNTVTGQNINFYINGILVQNIVSIEGYVSFNLTVIGEDGDLFPVNGTYDERGEYPIIINESLISVFVIGPINITKIVTNSTISAKNTTVGKASNITGIATDENSNILANIELSVIVDGKTYTVTINGNGEWTLTYIPTKVRNLDVSVLWKGNDTHNGFTNKAALNVSKRNILVTLTTKKDDDGSITIIANASYEDDENSVINHPVDFILDGKIIGIGITNKNDIAKLKIPANKINGEKHKITALIYGDDSSNDEKASTTFTRKNLDSPKPNNPNKTSNNSILKASTAMKKTGIPTNLIILLFNLLGAIILRKKHENK